MTRPRPGARRGPIPSATCSWSIEANQPIGWVSGDDIPASGTLDAAMANPVSPLVNRRTTLKDALSMMLDADVQAAVVVDRSGAVQGIMTVDRVARLMREGEHGRSFGIFGDVADETEAADEAVASDADPSGISAAGA